MVLLHAHLKEIHEAEEETERRLQQRQQQEAEREEQQQLMYARERRALRMSGSTAVPLFDDASPYLVTTTSRSRRGSGILHLQQMQQASLRASYLGNNNAFLSAASSAVRTSAEGRDAFDTFNSSGLQLRSSFVRNASDHSSAGSGSSSHAVLPVTATSSQMRRGRRSLSMSAAVREDGHHEEERGLASQRVIPSSESSIVIASSPSSPSSAISNGMVHGTMHGNTRGMVIATTLRENNVQPHTTSRTIASSPRRINASGGAAVATHQAQARARARALELLSNSSVAATEGEDGEGELDSLLSLPHSASTGSVSSIAEAQLSRQRALSLGITDNHSSSTTSGTPTSSSGLQMFRNYLSFSFPTVQSTTSNGNSSAIGGNTSNIT